MSTIIPSKKVKPIAVFAAGLILLGVTGCSSSPEDNEINKLIPAVEESKTTAKKPSSDDNSDSPITIEINPEDDGLSEADRNVVSTVETIHMMATDVVSKTPNYVDWEVSVDTDLQATILTLHKAEEDIDPDDPFGDDGIVENYFSYAEDVNLDITLERSSDQETIITVTGWSEDADLHTEDNPLVYSGE